jgi:hypothetical protein
VSHAPATAIAWARESVSPELVLVSPDLRQAALALLPERDPDGWRPRPYSLPPALVLPVPDETPILVEQHGAGELVALPASPTGRTLVLAAAVYAGQSVVGAALAGGALVGATVALAGLADVLHP